jgi:hypothetical protein
MEKTILLAEYVEMANDNDIYDVGFDIEEAQEWAEDGVFVTNFNEWLSLSGETRIFSHEEVLDLIKDYQLTYYQEEVE